MAVPTLSTPALKINGVTDTFTAATIYIGVALGVVLIWFGFVRIVHDRDDRMKGILMVIAGLFLTSVLAAIGLGATTLFGGNFTPTGLETIGDGFGY